MAEKAKKSKKDNKNMIIGCCAALVLIIAIIITIVLVVNNTGLNDNYFVSDGTKYVLTIETDETDEEDEFAPLKTHLVYTYEGDKVTGMKTYYVYADNASAQKAFDALKEAVGEEANSMELNGKYIIVTAEEESYKDLTASDVKQQIEFMEKLKNMNLDDGENNSGEETETVEETEEVEETSTEDEE